MPEIQFPSPLKILFAPKRYKVLYGGRSAGRSWGVARYLGIQAADHFERILCVRELQNSIAESCHKTIADQIQKIGLSDKFDIQRDRILGLQTHVTPEGEKLQSGFFFEGIKNNVDKIRSYEGITKVWAEEAVKITRASWKVLIPTVRRPGSEIIMTFNPALTEDYTYQRFVVKADPKRMAVVKMTWQDNPWVSQEILDEMEADREEDYDTYLNVWEGFPIEKLEGSVYAEELRRCQLEGRIGRVPWYKPIEVDTFWDLGRADATAIWFAQKVGMQWRVLDFYQARGQDITHFIKVLQSRPYMYGSHWLPHDGAAKRLGTKYTIQEMLAEKFPRSVFIVPKASVHDGINAARVLISQCWFDEAKCEEGLSGLRRYQYEKKSDGEFSDKPKHDAASDVADAFRTLAMSLRVGKIRPDVMEKFTKSRDVPRGLLNRALTGAQNWMR